MDIRQVAPGHIQLRGGKYLVNWYPPTNGNATGKIYVNGMRESLSGTWEDAVAYTESLPYMTPTTKSFVSQYQKRQMKKLLLRRRAKCHYCSVSLTLAEATIDHKIPLSRGGSTGYDNLCLCCYECNQRKGNQVLP